MRNPSWWENPPEDWPDDYEPEEFYDPDPWWQQMDDEMSQYEKQDYIREMVDKLNKHNAAMAKLLGVDYDQ